MRTSPLDATHRATGAKMVPFGGWSMPLAYGDGTIAEHMSCRSDSVVFDVSHLGTVRLAGPGAFDALQATLTNDLAKIGPGRAQYTHLLDPGDASVTDDIIVWWRDDNVFDIMPNASNTSGVVAAIGGVDVTDTRAIIAVQGPSARARLATVWPEAASVKRFHVARCDWRRVACMVAGTGYTGEDGVELAVPSYLAGEVWDAVVGAGAAPAGLGARDTLRLEAALPLHGHELGPGITPLQAGLGWVVSWTKGDFRGRDALAAEQERGVQRRLRGIAVAGRRPPRADCPVLIDGNIVGVTTSGNFSPVLQHGIALGFLPPHVAIGTEVTIEVRGTPLAGTVVATPFVSKTGHKSA